MQVTWFSIEYWAPPCSSYPLRVLHMTYWKGGLQCTQTGHCQQLISCTITRSSDDDSHDNFHVHAEWGGTGTLDSFHTACAGEAYGGRYTNNSIKLRHQSIGASRQQKSMHSYVDACITPANSWILCMSVGTFSSSLPLSSPGPTLIVAN